MTLHFLRNLGLLVLASAGGLAAASAVFFLADLVEDHFGVIGAGLTVFVPFIVFVAVLMTYAERNQKS